MDAVPAGMHPGHYAGHPKHETATMRDGEGALKTCLITCMYCQNCFECLTIDFVLTDAGRAPCAQGTLI